MNRTLAAVLFSLLALLGLALLIGGLTGRATPIQAAPPATRPTMLPADEVAASEAAPDIDPVTGFKRIDLGSAKPGEVRHAQIVLTNPSDAPADVRIVTSCGCTNPSYPQQLEPGQTLPVDVEVAVVTDDWPTQRTSMQVTVGDDVTNYLLAVDVVGYKLRVSDNEYERERWVVPGLISVGMMTLDEAEGAFERRVYVNAAGHTLRVSGEAIDFAGMPLSVEAERGGRRLVIRGNLRDLPAEASGFLHAMLPVAVIDPDGEVAASLEIPVVGRILEPD